MLRAAGTFPKRLPPSTYLDGLLVESSLVLEELHVLLGDLAL